ncbi:MAG: hypothetical protein ACJAYK_000065 [Crocinitomicaceae bacterium]|jgi:hypothetical protein
MLVKPTPIAFPLLILFPVFFLLNTVLASALAETLIVLFFLAIPCWLIVLVATLGYSYSIEDSILTKKPYIGKPATIDINSIVKCSVHKRLLGTGHIELETIQGTRFKIKNILNPKEVADKILEAKTT